MRNRLPEIPSQRKICIICEGNEEYEYIEKLKSLHVWNRRYNVIAINAKGNGNIPARYQSEYQNGTYEAIFVFCDTDKKPFEQYEDIKTKINDVHGMDEAANNIVIFANPCTMQIIILHWQEIILTSHKKNKNASIIEDNTGIKGYDAHNEQREQLFKQIDKKNYDLMKLRVAKLSKDDANVGSSNFITLIEKLSAPNDGWVDELNRMLG